MKTGFFSRSVGPQHWPVQAFLTWTSVAHLGLPSLRGRHDSDGRPTRDRLTERSPAHMCSACYRTQLHATRLTSTVTTKELAPEISRSWKCRIKQLLWHSGRLICPDQIHRKPNIRPYYQFNSLSHFSVNRHAWLYYKLIKMCIFFSL